MIGKQIQHYRIIEKLGQGGMGEVYLAEDTKLGRKVALKFLPPHYATDPDFKSRFEHEARAAAVLNHPNITTVHELGDFEGKPFIAMEYVEGEGLDQRIRSGSIKIDTAIKIALQVCEGLATAHEAGIIHRDVKPGNIFIDKSGRVKLLDFGLAKSRRATTDTQTGTTVGTVQYESPEQGRGDKVDQRSDLFSLGVVLYEMIAGRLPFQGEFVDAIRYAIASENPEPLARYKSDVPDALQRIVGKLLEKDPDLRYQNAAGVISDLKLLERDSGSRISTAYRPTQVSTRRRPRALAAILIPSVLIALALVTVLIVKPWKLQFSPSHEAIAEENRLAVMYFDNLAQPGDEQRLGEIAANLLITELSDSRGVQVVSGQRLYDILRQLGHEGLKSIDRDIATQVAQKARARWMLMGSILKVQPNIILTAQVVETSTGNTVASQRIDGTDGEEIFAIVDRLSADLRRTLEIPRGVEAQAERSVASVTTHSTESYREYLEGMELINKLFTDEAVTHFRRAVEIDSAFAMAYYRLATTGISTRAERDEWLRRAVRFSDQASEKERWYILAAQAFEEQNDSEAMELLRRVLDKYPEEKDAYKAVARYFREERLEDSAVFYLQRVIDIDPFDKTSYNTLAYAYNSLGEFEHSIEAINKYLELAPDEPNPLDSRGDLYAYNGQFTQAADSYRRALAIKPDFYMSLGKLGDMYLLTDQAARAESCYTALAGASEPTQRATGRSRLAAIPAYHGQLKEAVKVLNDGSAADRMERVQIGLVMKLLARGVIEWLREDLDAAAASLTEAGTFLSEFNPSDPDQLRTLRSWIEQQRGNVTTADSLLADYRARCEASGQPYARTLKMSEAMTALVQGDARRAVDLFEEADREEHDPTRPEITSAYFRACAYLEAGLPGEAVSHLEAALKLYSESWPFFMPMVALCHYRLGQAYEQSGWTRRAIEQYQIFVDLWKNADPDRDEVADARARLAKLGA